MSTATTHIETEKQLVPELRFKEFEGEFTLSKLGDELNLFNGYAFSSKDSSENGVRWVKIADVGINKMKLDAPSFLPSEFKEKHSKFLLHKGDYVVALTRPILGGKLKIAKVNNDFDGSLLNQRVGKLESKNDLEYMYCMLQQKSLISRIENRIAGTDPPNLSPNEIATLKTFIPSLPEQQKIASFLSAVDEKIQQLTKKKQLLEQYKKGVMQQLFHSAGSGHTSGQLRFKDENGNSYPDWEEKLLGEVGKIVSGLTYSPDDKNEDGVLVLRSSNVHGRKITYDDNVFVNVEVGGFNPLEENDVLICVRNGSKRLIGKNALISGKAIGVAFGAFMTVYRSESNLFLFHYFESVDYKKEVHKNLGATINSINGSDLKKFKIPFPSSPEQQKIATYLSSIDTKIESVKNQITQTQTFKKGLLQQMFVAA